MTLVAVKSSDLQTGLPLVRHHLLHFPNDPMAVKQQQQVCFVMSCHGQLVIVVFTVHVW